ncbi:TPA: phage scaffolding protein [Clostridioides difficile]|uniref:phage scaffolding protein n=2 Tax=Clostridioides difficile TaxID=1496 RepID=UPI0010B010C2|nr:phage scaffolding protein [Clostridioides difficile]VHR73752.1 scaffold protein [Clostridioides difficile]VHV22963.1 scaffold protein [Clostridioides difficile]HEL4320752.1 phage scaffolding protein [Clostridioides difficile]
MDWLKELLEGIKVEDNKIDVASLQKSIEKKIKETTVTQEDYVNLETQLNTANETIKKFEGGMTKEDVENLKTTYETDKKTLEETYKKEIEEKDFNYWLNDAFKSIKCRDEIALKAHLDIEALRNSKDRQKAFEEQINPLKQDKDYLFNATLEGEEPKIDTITPGQEPKINDFGFNFTGVRPHENNNK